MFKQEVWSSRVNETKYNGVRIDAIVEVASQARVFVLLHILS